MVHQGPPVTEPVTVTACSHGEAVRVLTKPFPFPEHLVQHVKVRTNPNGKLGVKFVWNGRKGSRVKIGGIGDESPMKETAIKVGHTVIAINSTPVLNPVQASGLVAHASGPDVYITTVGPLSENDPPFCKLITAPTSKEHPGISFDSTRKRCMVQVSRVFSRGPFAGSDLRQGDIVLAVNGIPVSKPEDADIVLRQSIDTPNTILYVVDLAQYRQSILTELQITNAFRKLHFETWKNNCGDTKIRLALGKDELSVLNVDYEQQHLNASEFKTFSKKRSNGARSRLIQQFLEAFNSRMDVRMRILEEAVYCEAWKHGLQNSSRKVPRLQIESSDEGGLQNALYTAQVTNFEVEPPFVLASLIGHELSEPNYRPYQLQ